MMLRTKFLTSFAAKALVVAVTAGGGMLISGVANADAPMGSPAGTGSSAPATPAPVAALIPTATPAPAATPAPTTTPAPAATPVPTATPVPVAGPGSPLGGLLPGGTGLGGLNPAQLVKPILDPILAKVSQATGLDLGKVTGPILGELGS
jgi:hypothetical protein